MLCIAMELMTSTGALSFLSILVAVIVVVVSYFGLARASSSCWKGIETGGFPAAEIDAYRKGLHVTISTKFGGSKNSLVYERAKQATTYLRDIGVKVYNPNTAIDEGLWDDGKGGNSAWLLHFREDGLLETLKAKGLVLQLQENAGEKSDMQVAEESMATEIGKSGVPVIGIYGNIGQAEILCALELANQQWKSGKICTGVQNAEDLVSLKIAEALKMEELGLSLKIRGAFNEEELLNGHANEVLMTKMKMDHNGNEGPIDHILGPIYRKMKEETDKCP